MTTSTSPTAATPRPVPRYGFRDHWTPAAIAFGALSIVGLLGTLALNALSVIEMRNYLGDWFGSGPAVNSLGVDLLVVAVAGSILIVLEAKRLRMKRAWLYIVLSAVTAFAFTFPLFLAMRERRLDAIRTAVSA